MHTFTRYVVLGKDTATVLNDDREPIGGLTDISPTSLHAFLRGAVTSEVVTLVFENGKDN